MARFSWRPSEPDPEATAELPWFSDVALVRPYVRPVHPEALPDSPRPALATIADCCTAAPTTVLWTVRLVIERHGWDLYIPDTVARVAELQLCGHHADVHEPAAYEQGWIAVLDTRQRVRDLAR